MYGDCSLSLLLAVDGCNFLIILRLARLCVSAQMTQLESVEVCLRVHIPVSQLE